MKIQPSGNRVLIKIVDKEVSEGGIFIPRGTLVFPASVGEVEAVGPGYLEDVTTNKWTPCTIKVGEKVLFSKEAGLKIPKEILRHFLGDRQAEDDYVLMQENQIYATIKEEPKDK